MICAKVKGKITVFYAPFASDNVKLIHAFQAGELDLVNFQAHETVASPS